MIFLALPLLVGAALLLSTHASLDSDVLQFASYVERFQRKYNEQEWTRRFQIFLKNKAKVAQLNAEQAGGEDVTFELDGPFADLTAEEFSSRLLPPRPSPHQEDATTNHVAEAPDAFDWRDKGAVTRVKDQGALGTCWAFSTAQTLEGQLFISHGQLMDLSVEQLVECDASFDKETTNGDCGVFGGWPYLAFQYIIDAGGLRSDSEMPYCSGWNNKTQCWPCMPKGYSTIGCGDHKDYYCNATTTKGQGKMGLCDSKTGAAARVASWSHVSTDEVEIASVLASVGPLSVLLNAQALQFYRQGVWNPKWCNAEDLDHAVLLVGYGTDGGADYWTVKNSWGEKWGEQGYFRIMRGVGKCGINTAVTYALVE